MPQAVKINNPTMPPKQQDQRHIWIITGPAGCGKSTVAMHLAQKLCLPYIEGDDYHPPSNVRKMQSGTPLNDADRWEWLEALQQKALVEVSHGSPGVVVTCSALKKTYRDVIRSASDKNNSAHVHFVYLRADEELLLARVKARQGHYMKDDMVRSQFEILEEPNIREEKDCLIVDVKGTVTEVDELVLKAVKGAQEKAADDDATAA